MGECLPGHVITRRHNTFGHTQIKAFTTRGEIAQTFVILPSPAELVGRNRNTYWTYRSTGPAW